MKLLITILILTSLLFSIDYQVKICHDGKVDRVINYTWHEDESISYGEKHLEAGTFDIIMEVEYK